MRAGRIGVNFGELGRSAKKPFKINEKGVDIFQTEAQSYETLADKFWIGGSHLIRDWGGGD